jgi:hypothetical protein
LLSEGLVGLGDWLVMGEEFIGLNAWTGFMQASIRIVTEKKNKDNSFFFFDIDKNIVHKNNRSPDTQSLFLIFGVKRLRNELVTY